MADFDLTEKVSVNINSSTLSQIDLLVDNGYYSNRSDFINLALRTALQQQQSILNRIIDRQTEASRQNKSRWFVGVCKLAQGDIEAMLREGGGFTVTGYGVLGFDEGMAPEKLFAAVKAIGVRGKVIAPEKIKAHYGLK